SAQAKETMFEAGDTQLPQNLGDDMGKTDKPPIVKAYPKDWFKKPKRPFTPDPEWNTGKKVNDGPTQNWLSNLISDLTKADLVGPVYNLLKVTNVKVNKWYGYGHLELIEVRSADQQLYKFMERDFPRLHLNDIEDMLLLVLERNRPMRTHEFYKFSDGTLISVWDKLKDMANNLELGYNSVMPRRRWSNLDKKRSRIMVKDIDRQLLERRLLRSLENLLVEGNTGKTLDCLSGQYDFVILCSTLSGQFS
ncbi:hypothetical protein Tco_1262501, partial [Tanacetum coccineum]